MDICLLEFIQAGSLLGRLASSKSSLHPASWSGWNIELVHPWLCFLCFQQSLHRSMWIIRHLLAALGHPRSREGRPPWSWLTISEYACPPLWPCKPVASWCVYQPCTSCNLRHLPSRQPPSTQRPLVWSASQATTEKCQESLPKYWAPGSTNWPASYTDKAAPAARSSRPWTWWFWYNYRHMPTQPHWARHSCCWVPLRWLYWINWPF